MVKPSLSIGSLPQGIGAVAKYNPHLWGPEELKAIFVARQQELALLTQAIRDAEPESSPQHILLIGQRGMGKTTLLQRIALQVEEDEALSKDWLALRFPEEQYTVNNLAELWGNVLGALADALEAKGESTVMIDQNLLILESLPVEQREQQTLALINQWCEEYQQRLLLLIDSTDLLFDNLNDSKKSQKDAVSVNLWRLRNTLQNNPNLFWLGGSYQALEGSDLYHDAFQDFFQMVELKPLTLEEIQQAMRAMARAFGTGGGSEGAAGDAAEAQINKALTERPERLKTLRQLTGGNPRTTVMLFELFASSGNNQVRSDLERLLDMMTPLYKARLEALADQQRKLIAHIMETWQPVSLGELAKISGMANTKISPLLIRMEKDGLIIKTPLPNTSRAGYQAAERFFNIWYLMRNAPRRLKLRLAWLVEFMRMWYKPDELETIANQRMRRHSKGRPELDDLEYSRAVASAMPPESQARRLLDYQLFKELQAQKQKLSEFFDFDGDDKPFKSIDDYCQRFEALRHKLMQLPFAKTEQEKTDFCELVLTSINLSMQQKEVMVDSELSESNFSETIEILQDEAQQWEENMGEEGFAQLKDLILNQDFYLDFPDKDIARIQIKEHLIGYRTFYWHIANAYWDKFKDDSIDELIVIGLKQSHSAVSHYNWHEFEGLLQSRLNSFQVSEAITEWFELDLNEANQYILVFVGYLFEVTLNRFEQAEQAYRKAIELGGTDSIVYCNLARLYAAQQKADEATKTYRIVLEHIDSESEQYLILQSQLWLNNTDSANQALTQLAEKASQGENFMFFRIKEQCWECQQIGRGEALADLMANNAYAEFLKPFELALRTVNGDSESIKGAAVEIQQLAEEVVLEIRKRLKS